MHVQKYDYDGQFEYIVNNLKDTPRLLLHVCCAPCATFCLTKLLEKFDVTLFYSNDNITDKAEWDKRLGELHKLVGIVNGGKFEVQPTKAVKLVVKDFDNTLYYNAVKGYETNKEGETRCEKCFAMRLDSARQYATENGFDYFGTTLTVSPYKNTKLINQIGYALQTDKTKWLPASFKKHNGYDESIRLSEKYGLYRQHYCGCEFSLTTPYEK